MPTEKSSDLFKNFSQQVRNNLDAFQEVVKAQFDPEICISMLSQAFNAAQSNLHQGENPERQVVRFALDLALLVLQSAAAEQQSKTGGISAAQSSQQPDTVSSQMRDTLSEIISETVSSVPITDNSHSMLQKRNRKTQDKDESRIKRDQAIADHMMSYSAEQVEDMSKRFEVHRSQIDAPCGPSTILPASYYSRLKLPKAKDLLHDALMMLHGQQGTK